MSMEEKKLKIGDKVEVMRQIGKNATSRKVTGVINRFMNLVYINGEKTALVKYDDNGEKGAHQLSKIQVIAPIIYDNKHPDFKEIRGLEPDF